MNNRLESNEPAQDSLRDDSPLPQPNPKARALHTEIITRLKGLLSASAASPLDPLFKSGYAEILELFDTYQREIVAASDYRVTCKKNCSLCCYHWVADVYSFEAAIIADHIKACLPQNVAALCAELREDATLLQRLDDALDERVLKDAAPHTLAALDRDDLLLEGFYQLRRPCALLDSQGACSMYRLRPMSCRTYLSFSEPLLCDPDTIYYHEVRTCLCTLEDEADELLGELHERYDSCGGDTSLRTLLPYYLEGFRDCILKRVI